LIYQNADKTELLRRVAELEKESKKGKKINKFPSYQDA
jgi:hypothetical protein